MSEQQNRLRVKIEALLETWREMGIPARATLLETIEGLIRWRTEEGVPGLWPTPPRMMGATMDDGWGHGMELILKCADALGVETRFSGLLQTWKRIVEACESFRPDILGLTVLQFDTEDDLLSLRRHLPKHIQIVAGGPVFKIDPELAERVGIDYVARDAADFMAFMAKRRCPPCP